jgi:2,4-dienoyl-CoA reductase-like NADH-dependent reductase (Old Yellow Enzyme family)
MASVLFSPIRLADLELTNRIVVLGRAFLDDPHWSWHAAAAHGASVARPNQYRRAEPKQYADPKIWPGAGYRD